MALFAPQSAGRAARRPRRLQRLEVGRPRRRASVRCPALVVIGANDIMTPPKNGRELAGLIAGSRTVTIPDCGHMMLAEAPDAVLDALIEFFANAEAA